MKLKEAKQIIDNKFYTLKKEDRSQYDTLVSLLVKYGADDSHPLDQQVSREVGGQQQKDKLSLIIADCIIAAKNTIDSTRSSTDLFLERVRILNTTMDRVEKLYRN